MPINNQENSRGNFFAVELGMLHKIADMGLNEACLYLIYCCGSGKDNSTTKWSVNALTKYTRISVRRGKKAAEQLNELEYITVLKSGKHPKFRINHNRDNEQVWLPNQFVTGANGEIPPLELLRQTGDPMILKLLIDLYARCNIAEDGGVQTNLCYGRYERKKIADHKQYIVWGFSNDGVVCYPNHREIYIHLTEDEQNSQALFDRIQILKDLGLIYSVPTLFDSDGGEPITPIIDPFTEESISAITGQADTALPDDVYGEELNNYDYVLLVPRTFKSVVLKDTFIPRYRQQTALNRAGYAKTRQQIESWLKVLGVKQD